MKKYLSFLLICFLFPSCQASESGRDEIWGIETSELEKSLQSGDYSFIDSLNLNRLKRWGRLEQISEFRRGGAFYFSFLMEQRGDRDWQIRFLEEELNSGVYIKEAADEIYRLLSFREQWDEMVRIFSGAEVAGKDSGHLEDYLFEALFKSGQEKKLLRLDDGIVLSLYSMKALIKGNDDFSEEVFSTFLFNRASISEVVELYDLLLEENLFYNLTENVKSYVLACSAYSDGQIDDLRLYLEKFTVSDDLAKQYPSLIYKLRLPIERARLEKEWGEKLKSLSSFESRFTAGRLYSSIGLYDQADEQFRKAYDLAEASFEQDRARWYLMNLYRSNASYMTGMIEEAAPRWHDPSYFSDLLEEYLSQIASGRRWDLLERIYPIIIERGDRESIAAFSWMRFLSAQPGSFSSADVQTMFSHMRGAPHYTFYNLMGHLLDQKPLGFDNYVPTDGIRSDADDYILGFYDFSLDETALDRSRGIEDQLSDALLRSLSLQARDQGDYLRSIQIANYIQPGAGRLYSEEDLKLKYPLAYGELIDNYSTEYGFPSEILKGIIRTESAYTKDIVSYAGAVGLSQLMPDTAAEQARKLGIDNPDLTDPETNIRIGSSYVRWILDRPWNDNLSQMLIAYNGGGGNLRKWKRMYPRHGDELFVEAIPYKETRNYVKKVLTSSVIYGSVYGGQSPEDIVRKIYPDFLSLKESSPR